MFNEITNKNPHLSMQKHKIVASLIAIYKS